MILRPYQSRLVKRAKKALDDHGNTLAIAATGAGKTIMLSELCRRVGGRQLILQHRQELVDQNMAKYRIVNEKARVGMYTADVKTWRGDAIFAMQQTLCRNLHTIPVLDLCVVDEAHHVAARTYAAIIEAVKAKNPNCLIAGFTATPERSDRKALRGFFDNVCDQVTVRELVRMGFLVPPKAFVVDVSGTTNRIKNLRASDFSEQAEVEKILNTSVVNAEVVRHWREKAGGRRTIVFCSTVQHAEDVAEAFRQAGVSSECVHGELSGPVRADLLKRLGSGHIQVLTNVMVLTEGFDCPPVSSVVLLRKCSAKSTMIQMVGRGLRTANPEEWPGVVKRDCVVLDFGASLLSHGDLDSGADLGEDRDPSDLIEGAEKTCPKIQDDTDTYNVPDVNGFTGCGAVIPAQSRTCPLCGFTFDRLAGPEEVTVVELTELDILNASPFRYCDLFGSGRALMASGFSAWAGVFSPDAETWTALGLAKGNGGVHRLVVGDKIPAMAAADDFLRTNENDSTAKKTKRWLDEPATDRQLGMLARFGYDVTTDMLGQSAFTKYAAACHANFQFERRAIEAALGV